MAIGLCPNCRQRYSYYNYDADYVHECNSGINALDEEDRVKYGDYVDEVTGNTIAVPNANLQGTSNKLFASNADVIYGKDLETLSPRGKRTSTHRARQRFTYINLKNAL